MALQLKLTKYSLSDDGTTLVVKDTTGAYNGSTNPGGYGTPNPDPATLVQLRWKMLESCEWELISGAYTVADIVAGFSITTINTGLSTDLRLLPDGVEQVQLLEGYPIATKTLTPSAGSTLVGLGTFTADDFVGIKYISFQTIPNEIFKILSIVGSTMTLDKIYDGAATTELINHWYEAELYVLIQTYGNNQINKDLTKVTADNLTGDALMNLTKRTMNSFAATARFDSGDYLGANTLALDVANYARIKRYGS
jgi:hypothetical protein